MIQFDKHILQMDWFNQQLVCHCIVLVAYLGSKKHGLFIIAKNGWHATSCINFKLGDRCSLSLGDVPCYLRISCLLSQWLTGLNFWGLHMLVGKMSSLNLYFMVLWLSKVVMFKDMIFFLIPWFSWSQVINEKSNSQYLMTRNITKH